MMRSGNIIAGLLAALLGSGSAGAAPLFSEDFNAEISVKGRHRQAQSGLPIKHGYDAMPGWTRAGARMPAHFVERAPGDWALMIVAREAGDNTFTRQEVRVPNKAGRVYTVVFQRLRQSGNKELCTLDPNWQEVVQVA